MNEDKQTLDYKEPILNGLISLIVAIIVAFVTSCWTIENKLNEKDRGNLNKNFKEVEKSIKKLNDHHFYSYLLFSKLAYTRKDLKPSDIKEIGELLRYLRELSPKEFDAITMSIDNKNCESFREFYNKNKEMIHKNHLKHLKSKIEACVPQEDRYSE